MGAFDGPGADPTIEALALQYGFDYEAAEQNLAMLFRMAHDHILEAVQRAILARPDRTPTQLIRLLNVVDAQYARALTGGARLVGSNTLNAFNVGAQAAEEQMARQRVRLHTSWVQVNRGAVQALQQEQMSDLLRATTLTEERVKARVRRVMLEETRMMAATGMRAKEQAKVISERMAEDGVFGITAKNGRHIPMDEYARVVAHTKLREAHTTGTEQLVAENGHDLVRVTTHLHRPDACSPLEGKVYSISGRTPGYPPLVRHTPFHPGCRHVETPFIETFRSEAELEKTREESNRPGQITVYPQAQLDELEAKQKKRQRFMRAKRELRKQDQIDIGAGKKDAPKDPKAYERSLTARANARVRAANARANAAKGSSGSSNEDVSMQDWEKFGSVEGKQASTSTSTTLARVPAEEGRKMLEEAKTVETAVGGTAFFTRRSITHIVEKVDADERLQTAPWVLETLRSSTETFHDVYHEAPKLSFVGRFREPGSRYDETLLVHTQPQGNDLRVDSWYTLDEGDSLEEIKANAARRLKAAKKQR